MAPQSTTYGALDLTKRNTQQNSTTSVKLIVGAAFVAIALTAAVFSVSSVSTTKVASVENSKSPYAGDDLVDGRDCPCSSVCTAIDGAYYGECTVDTAEVSDGDCIGFDYTYAYLGGDDGATWLSHCEIQEGKYDCSEFPCINGGYCVDGADTYTCVCPFGYEGVDCEIQIDECVFEGDESELAVCNEHADCTDREAAYDCACKSGFKGDGYTENQDLVKWGTVLTTAVEYGWLDRSAAGYADAGCTDINDCASNPCQNGGECIDLWESEGKSNAFKCNCAVILPNKRFSGDFCESDVDECEGGLHNCDHEERSKCTNTIGSFNCECREFWEGDGFSVTTEPATWGCTGNCAEAAGYTGCSDIDDCVVDVAGQLVSPCQNGGTCSNDGEGTGLYACACVVGWRGHDCEVDIDECVELTEPEQGCDEHAYCSNTDGSWNCLCNVGWTGEGDIHCFDADDCEFSPCLHGGTCEDCGTLCYLCDCVIGWRGKSCEKDWNECTMGIHTCHDMALCINTPGSFTCECEPGFSGDGYRMCNEVNDCYRWQDGPERDEALVDYAIKTFNDDGTLATYDQEVSPAPWADDSPIIDKNDVLVHQCGVYNAALNDFTPHGTCTDVGPAAFLCVCDRGWSDANCDLDIDECARGIDMCARYSTCTNNDGSYECACNQGYTGDGVTSCTDIDDCTVGDESCMYGICTDLGVLDFRCTCTTGWMDRLCDYNIDECATMTHTCHDNAVCTDTDGSYKCECLEGYDGDGIGGKGCDDVDECGSSPCENGVCVDNGRLSWSCTCEEGWTDTRCDHDMNECYMNTHDCHADGKCVNTPGGFYCRCVSGMAGDGYTCTDLDDCDPDPCDPVHGTCNDLGSNKYVCECSIGFEGIDCGSSAYECIDGSHECDPNAMCIDTYGSYKCACNAEFYGDGQNCAPCTDCKAPCEDGSYTCGTGPGYVRDESTPPCDAIDRTCMNVDECMELIDNCDGMADCTDNVGSFTCECQIGNQHWGEGTDGTCSKCTECGTGDYMFDDCTSTRDRVCKVILQDGDYAVATYAQGIEECLVRWKEAQKVFPERYNWGGRTNSQTESADISQNQARPGADYCKNPVCGVCDWDGKSALQNIAEGLEAVWTFRRLKDDLYLIFNRADGNGYRCLGFENAQAPYPTLMVYKEVEIQADYGFCVDGDGIKESEDECSSSRDCADQDTYHCEIMTVAAGSWDTEAPGVDTVDLCTYENGFANNCELNYFCGFETNSYGSGKEKLLANSATVWSVHALGCDGLFCEDKTYDNQFILRSAASGDKNKDGLIDKLDYECMYFPFVGQQEPHPRRVPSFPSDDGVWLGTRASSDVDANGDIECGINAGEGSQESALVANKQATFSLIKL